MNRDPGTWPAGSLEHLATFVVRNQVGTWPILAQSARVGYATLNVLLAALEHLGVLGPAGPRAKREVLVPYTDLDAVLVKVRAYERGDIT